MTVSDIIKLTILSLPIAAKMNSQIPKKRSAARMDLTAPKSVAIMILRVLTLLTSLKTRSTLKSLKNDRSTFGRDKSINDISTMKKSKQFHGSLKKGYVILQFQAGNFQNRKLDSWVATLG